MALKSFKMSKMQVAFLFSECLNSLDISNPVLLISTSFTILCFSTYISYKVLSHFGTSSTSSSFHRKQELEGFTLRENSIQSPTLLVLSHRKQGSGLRLYDAIIGEISCVGPQAWHWITNQSPAEAPSRGAKKQRCPPPANLCAGLPCCAAGSNTFN